MFPKVGDVVKLNPDFLKIWFDKGRIYFGEEVWEENLIITGVDFSNFEVSFKSKDYEYNLHILSNGELSNWREEFKDIQVFVSANLEKNNNDIYCSCGGTKKENWVFGERFYVCTICKKEVI